MKSNNYSLKSKIWSYLIIFSIVILIFLWLFQVIFLKSYYKWMKTRDIKKIITTISNSYGTNNFDNILDELTFSNNICIEILDGSKIIYSSNSQIRGCLNDKDFNNWHYLNEKSIFLQSNQLSFEYETTNPIFKNKTLVHGKKLSYDLSVFVTTSLEPLDSTINILASQLIYVTIVVLLLSFIVSYFISKKISKPIVKINENAKKLIQKNYKTEFSTNSNIQEINELSETLNKTANELSKTENLRRELLANVSHDLKTPLTMIKAYAEMARDLNNKNERKRKDNLEIIIEETDRLNLLVNDILELSKFEANVNKLNIEKFNLINLIQAILKRYNYLENNENYIFNFEYETNNIVKADKKRIEQVLINLINNAINHTYEKKTITIKVENINNDVKINIIDYGKGIDKKDINLIWDKYYKVDKTYKRETNGTGLGLSIVKNILINHGFEYGVSSEKNKGTTFWFIIK